jgi:2-amino-4-hydroxy-6-hydroxymethyldihydropteridine diphosphokinase
MRMAYIGMGGNVASGAGTPEATLAAATRRLESLGRVVSQSSLYSTEPVGYSDQPRFVNAVVGLETELEPRELLVALMAIEKDFGRDRAASFANGPRPLDLDILLLGDLQISEPDLLIPHPRLAERGFVLVPLWEIAPQLVVAGLGKTVAELLHILPPIEASGAPPVIKIQGDGWWRTALGPLQKSKD